MASKTKQKQLKEMNRKKTATAAVLVAMVGAILAILQNRHGQLSDIRSFYGIHFSDGQHTWPFSTHTLLDSTQAVHPVEYPALTGLVMWFFSFFIKPAEFAWGDYYRLTASVHVLLFGLLAWYHQKLSSQKLAIIFALSPAVLYSLHRNWDIWAVLPMVISLYQFSKNKKVSSAAWLSISIATKFFPVVILLPILVYFIKIDERREALRYLRNTFVFWFGINLPFILINFRGWSYFYEFNYSRGIGSASVFDIASKLGHSIPSQSAIFLALNLFSLVIILLFLYKQMPRINVIQGSFFTMFAFMLFNKQYSMQYVIWLASLAILAINGVRNDIRNRVLFLYVIWQVSELLFQYTFFQNILTNYFASIGTPTSPQISASFYAVSGVIRYISALSFASALAYFLLKNEKLDPTSVNNG